jgi:CxxC-x17-CxxC domain-containing protein
MSRVDTPEKDRKDFFLYIDEFQNFATKSFVNILSEARKYRFALILANQYITQMEEEVRDAIFGNVGSMIIFRVGAEDAEFLEKEFLPDITATDLVNLGKYNIYLKLMIDGLAGAPFSAETLPPWPREYESNKEKVIALSREKYGTPRSVIEEKISRWTDASTTAEPQIQANQPTLFDARCAMCGKDTKVTFQPDGKRPVYCKTCLKKKQKESEGMPKSEPLPRTTKEVDPEKKSVTESQKTFASLPTISLEDIEKKEAVPFAPSKKENQKPEKKRKEVDLAGLKAAINVSLKDALKDTQKESIPKPIQQKTAGIQTEEAKESDKQQDNVQKGEIKPGETIQFK